MSGLKGLSHTLHLKNGKNLRVDCLGAGIFRIRTGAGDCLHESGLNRYGIIRIKPDMPADSVNIAEHQCPAITKTTSTGCDCRHL